jgi:hypothetical protein
MLRGDYLLDEAGERIHLARGDEDPAAEWLDDARVKRRLAELAGRSQTESPTHLLDLVDLLRAPDRYAVKPAHGMGALLLLSLALPLALPARPERRRAAILVGLLGWGSFALLGSQTALLRYAAPALPLLAAATGLVLSRVPWQTLRVAIAAVALVLLVRDYQTQEHKLELLQPELVLSAEPSPWRDPAARLAWLKQVGFNFTPPMAHLVEAVAKEHAAGRIDEHCRIFMVGEGKGRLLPCDFLPDASWFAHRFVAELTNADLDLDRIAKSLHSRGVTHVLYNRDYYDWVLSDTNTSPARVAFALAHLEHFLEANARPLIRVGGLGLFELHTRAAER